MKKTLSERIQKIVAYARAHKIISTLVVIAVLYFGYSEYKTLTSTTGETRYVLSTAQKGAIVVSLTGSGQVSTSNQIDVKPKVSGDVVYVGVTNGEQVKAGTLIAELDATDAQKSVRDAQLNLDSAKLSLSKLLLPADALSLLQTENALAQASSTYTQAYSDGYTSVSNAFLNLPTIMTGTQDILSGTELDHTQQNLFAYADLVKTYDDSVLSRRDDVSAKYQIARAMYDKTFAEFTASSQASSHSDIETLIADTYQTSKDVSDVVKGMNDMLGFVKDKLVLYNKNIPALLTTHQGLLNTYIGQTNSAISDLLGIQTTITNSKYSIAEKTQSLTDLQAGATPIDIQSAQLSVTQRQNALLDAQDNLSNYYVRAPFDGTIAKLDVKKGDSASSGTAVATLITAQKIAQVSLNEVDVAKVQLGQKATLTFDAIDGLSIAGVVSDIDTVGTVSQGVVTYTVTITFDTQDDRVKSGMSVSAAIITNMKQDALTVPNSAVKTSNGSSYVLLFNPPLAETATSSANTGIPSPLLPMEQSVTVGLSNDSVTEIVSGLTEGEQVVTRTIAGTTTTTTTSAPSLLNAAGVRTGAGGGTRATTPVRGN